MKKYRLCELVEAVRFNDYPEIVQEIRTLLGKEHVQFLRGKGNEKYAHIMNHGREFDLHIGEWLVVSAGGVCVMSDEVFKKNYVEEAD